MPYNSKLSMDDYIEQRLIEWAEWFGQNTHDVLGYPRNSSINMFLQGSIVKKNKRKAAIPLPSHIEAEEMETYINEMHKQNVIMASAIRLHYLDHLSMRKNAKKLGLSHTYFKLYIQMGKQWLAGKLTLSKS
jgi:hypothetical protein